MNEEHINPEDRPRKNTPLPAGSIRLETPDSVNVTI